MLKAKPKLHWGGLLSIQFKRQIVEQSPLMDRDHDLAIADQRGKLGDIDCGPWMRYSSQRCHTAVHEQQGAGDMRGIVGGENQVRGDVLRGPARALQHGALRGFGVVLRDGFTGRCEAPLMERCEDQAKADGVHTNAFRRVIGGERPRQARTLGPDGVIPKVAAVSNDGANGGEVNDGAALVAAQKRNRRLGTEDVAHRVDVEDLGPVVNVARKAIAALILTRRAWCTGPVQRNWAIRLVARQV